MFPISVSWDVETVEMGAPKFNRHCHLMCSCWRSCEEGVIIMQVRCACFPTSNASVKFIIVCIEVMSVLSQHDHSR